MKKKLKLFLFQRNIFFFILLRMKIDLECDLNLLFSRVLRDSTDNAKNFRGHWGVCRRQPMTKANSFDILVMAQCWLSALNNSPFTPFSTSVCLGVVNFFTSVGAKTDFQIKDSPQKSNVNEKNRVLCVPNKKHLIWRERNFYLTRSIVLVIWNF